MALKWRLRQVMADRGIWSGAELSRLMEQKAGYKLSAPSISALLTDSVIETGQSKEGKQETQKVVNGTVPRILPPI